MDYMQALLNQQKQSIPTPKVTAPKPYVPQTAANVAVKTPAIVNQMPTISTPVVNAAQTANGGVKIQQQAPPVIPIPQPNVAPSLSPVATVPANTTAANPLLGYQGVNPNFQSPTSPYEYGTNNATMSWLAANTGIRNVWDTNTVNQRPETVGQGQNAAAYWIEEQRRQAAQGTTDKQAIAARQQSNKTQYAPTTPFQSPYAYYNGGIIPSRSVGVARSPTYMPQSAGAQAAQSWMSQPGPSNLGGGPLYMSADGTPTTYWYGTKPPAAEEEWIDFFGDGGGGGGYGGGGGGGGGYGGGYGSYATARDMGLSNWRYGF